MTDVYRSEVLGAVMQQIVDQPTLPTLFLRTVRLLPVVLAGSPR
jgi:symplekin